MWQCKEHNQDEWECLKGNGKDEYYHVQRLKSFEQNIPIEKAITFVGWLIPNNKHITIPNKKK